MTVLAVRIVGHTLPGTVFGEHRSVHVGLKKGKEHEGVVAADADADEVVFDLHVEIRPDRAGRPDYRGPYICGLGKEDRAVCLVWVDRARDGTDEVFRGAKLRLPPIDEELQRVAADGTILRADVTLTDARGGPVCARVPADLLTWSFVEP